MLSEPVPSARSELGSTVAPVADGGPEEPEPPSTRARLIPAARDSFNRVAFSRVAAMAFVPFAPALAPPLGPTVPELLDGDPWVVSISPLYALLAIAAAALGSYGAIAAGSLIGYSPTRLSQLLDERRRPDKDKLVQELSTRDREYFTVATIFAGIGCVLGLLALNSAVDPGTYPWALGAWVALMLFVAGSLPGAIADNRSESAVLRTLPLLRAGWHLLRWPLVLPLHGLTRLAVRALRLQREHADTPREVQKQVMAAVADNVDKDELADAERTWIGNIIALKDQQVSTVMTPRPDIIALPESMSLHQALDQALEHEFSRYPVYRDRIDEVVGIFYIKDALRLIQQGSKKTSETPLRTLLREPLFVPETTSTAQLLHRVQAGNQHMAIVIDEYGTTVGLATIEDLVEEIVGEIEDEFDAPASEQPEEQQIRVIEEGRVFEIPARTSVQDLNRILGSQLADEGDWDTVAGLVINSCNHIPPVGETVIIGDVEFRVLEANERRVHRLRVTVIAPAEAEGSR